jgi:hypothetical protein
MRHVQASLLSVLVTAVLSQAAPPVVTVPAEVTGDVAAFVVVRAEVKDGKAAKFVAVDPGLSVFPPGLLADPFVTVVVGQRAGRYRILCYSGNADGPSEPVTVTVVIGGGAAPIIDPVKPDPVKPADVYYFAVVRPDQNTQEFESLMRLPAWDEVRKTGHLVKDIPISELPTGIDRPATLPAVVILRRNADGKTWTDLKRNKPMPRTDDAIRGLIR